MSRALVCALAVLAPACGPSGDPLEIRYRFTDGAEQACVDKGGDPITDCNDVPMSCDSVALLRIVDPDHPTTVYVDQCVVIPNDSRDHNLCQIAQAQFDIGTFPTDLVEVQLAIYPKSALIDEVTQEVVCPSAIHFTATGFVGPDNDTMPALAGKGYADGYDNTVTIDLGCNDLELIDSPVCRNENVIDLTASVVDFDSQQSVAGMIADQFLVRVGSPHPSGQEWVFEQSTSADLILDNTQTPPRWLRDDSDVALVDYACAQVLRVEARATASLVCRALTSPLPSALDFRAVKVDKFTLTQLLEAASLPDFPMAGLVIGVVVDSSGHPVAGDTVSDSAGSMIEYITADRLGTVPGGTMTTTSGIFVAKNAPFDFDGGPNHWTVSDIQLNDPVGGKVQDRLTVIVIQTQDAL